MKKQIAVFFTYLSWLIGGLFLLFKGINTLPKEGGQLLVALAAGIGVLNYVFFLQKSAHVMISHIRNLPPPFHLLRIYPKRFLYLIGGIVAIALVFKVFPLKGNLQGFIDLVMAFAMLFTSGEFLQELIHPNKKIIKLLKSKIEQVRKEKDDDK